MTRKYEFTGETRGNLKRIRRLSDGLLGGWIEHEGNLYHADTAWVGDEAQVWGRARVSGEAQVCGDAQVYGAARIYGSAKISDNAQIHGCARVYGSALVANMAQVYDHAIVYGRVYVLGRAWLFGSAEVCDNARVTGSARVSSLLKTVVRTDGYTFSLFPCEDGEWRLVAGCRYFTMEEAWKHWQATRADTDLGEETFDILRMFERHIERETRKAKPSA